jgi:hypothetical protein
MLTLHPKFISESGRKVAVLPYKEFKAVQELLEDHLDLQLVKEARKAHRGKKGLTLAQLRKKMDLN